MLKLPPTLSLSWLHVGRNLVISKVCFWKNYDACDTNELVSPPIINKKTTNENWMYDSIYFFNFSSNYGCLLKTSPFKLLVNCHMKDWFLCLTEEWLTWKNEMWVSVFQFHKHLTTMLLLSHFTFWFGPKMKFVGNVQTL